MTKAQKKFLLTDAAKYVETLEKELTPAAAQNAYHALVKAYNVGQNIDKLRERYDIAVNKTNDRFPC